MKLSKQSDGSVGVFKVYTQQDSRLRDASPCVFFMNKPQLWRLIGKDVVSQFKPVSAGVPLTSIRLVNIITLGLMVSDVGGVSVSKSSVVLIPCLQNTAATVCLAQRTLSCVAARCSSLEPLEPKLYQCARDRSAQWAPLMQQSRSVKVVPTEVWMYKYCELSLH